MQQKVCQVCQTTWVLEYPLDRMLTQDRKMTEDLITSAANVKCSCRIHGLSAENPCMLFQERDWRVALADFWLRGEGVARCSRPSKTSWRIAALLCLLDCPPKTTPRFPGARVSFLTGGLFLAATGAAVAGSRSRDREGQGDDCHECKEGEGFPGRDYERGHDEQYRRTRVAHVSCRTEVEIAQP